MRKVNDSKFGTRLLHTILIGIIVAGCGRGGDPSENPSTSNDPTSRYVVNQIDINRVAVPNSSVPRLFDTYEGWLYFSAYDRTNGRQLWRTNNSTTQQLTHFDPEGFDDEDYPRTIAVLNHWVYFVANDGTHGLELWRTDGNSTELVKDINPGKSHGANNTWNATVFKEWVYFLGYDKVHGGELWRTNGTVTEMVRDINPGTGYGYYNDYGTAQLDGWLYFVASDPVNNTVLWRTNGDVTEIANREVAPTSFYTVGGRIFFISPDGTANHYGVLWSLDSSGYHELKSLGVGGYDARLFEFQDELYFLVQEPTNVFQLWKSDGITATQVSNFANGASAYRYTSFKATSKALFFTVSDPNNGAEVWRYSGTKLEKVSGFTSVRAGSSRIQGFETLGDWYYFQYDDGNRVLSFWRTNGTQLEQVNDADSNSNINEEIDWGGTKSLGESLIFSTITYAKTSDESSTVTLWSTDGRQAAAKKVGSFSSGPNCDCSPLSSTAKLGNRMYFNAFDKNTGDELWYVDGTQVKLVADIHTGNGSLGSAKYWYSSRLQPQLTAGSFVTFAGWNYFSADDGIHGLELWRTDGVQSQMVYDINAGAADGNPYILGEFDKWLYFGADNSTPAGQTESVFGPRFTLWRTDGTAVELVKNGDLPLYEPSFLMKADGWFYFTAQAGIGKGVYTNLWRSNGIVVEKVIADNNNQEFYRATSLLEFGGATYFIAYASGKNAVWRIRQQTLEFVGNAVNAPGDNSQKSLIVSGNWIYYVSYDNTSMQYVLWRTNGDAPQKVKDLGMGYYDTTWGIVSFRSELYFLAFDQDTGVEWWHTSINGAELLKDINSNKDDYYHSMYSSSLLQWVTQNYFYFIEDDGVNGPQIWRTDGQKTEKMTSFIPSDPSLSLNFNNFYADANGLFFSITGSEYGNELWRLDDTGLRRLTDINPGNASSDIHLIFHFRSWQYFIAYDGQQSTLWRTDGQRTLQVLVSGEPISGWDATSIEFDGNLFFSSWKDGVGTELWRTDGDVVELVKNFNPAGSGNPGNFVVRGDRLYFTATDGQSGVELWELHSR